MKKDHSWDVLIIGAGMAGLSAAIWARRLGLSALVLERTGHPGGQLTSIYSPITDYPGLDQVRGQSLAEALARQAVEAGAILHLDHPVLRVNANQHSCLTEDRAFRGKGLVLATGLSPRRLHVPGERELHQAGLVRRPSQDPDWFAGKVVAIVGGGDRAAENAVSLNETASRVYLIHRGDQLSARSEFQVQLRSSDRVTVLLNTHVQAFRLQGHYAAVEAVQYGRSLHLEVDAVCIYIGNQPNTELVAGQLALTADGYIRTDRWGRTSLPGVFAAGDVCTPPMYQSLVTAAGQAMSAVRNIVSYVDKA